MAVVRVREVQLPWTEQPTEPTGLQHSPALAANAGAGLIELVEGSALQTQGNATIGSDKGGKFFETDYAGNPFNGPFSRGGRASTVDNRSSVTVAFVAQSTPGAFGDNRSICVCDANGGYGWRAVVTSYDPTHLTIGFGGTLSGFGPNIKSYLLQVDDAYRPIHIAMTWDVVNSVYVMCAEGKVVDSGSYTGPFDPIQSSNPHLEFLSSSTTVKIQGGVVYAGYNPSLALLLSENVWRNGFEPQRVMVPMSGIVVTPPAPPPPPPVIPVRRTLLVWDSQPQEHVTPKSDVVYAFNPAVGMVEQVSAKPLSSLNPTAHGQAGSLPIGELIYATNVTKHVGNYKAISHSGTGFTVVGILRIPAGTSTLAEMYLGGQASGAGWDLVFSDSGSGMNFNLYGLNSGSQRMSVNVPAGTLDQTKPITFVLTVNITTTAYALYVKDSRVNPVVYTGNLSGALDNTAYGSEPGEVFTNVQTATVPNCTFAVLSVLVGADPTRALSLIANPWSIYEDQQIQVPNYAGLTYTNKLQQLNLACIAQPQGHCEIDYSSQLLAGATVLALIKGDSKHNLADGKPLVISGSTVSTTFNAPCPGGVGLYSGVLPAAATDFGVSANTGMGYSVDFWYGVWGSGSSNNNQYLFGDYNGTTGGGLTPYHTGASGMWGFYDVTNTLIASGEFLTNGQTYCFVVVRKNTINGARDVYRDGVVKMSISSGASNQAPWAVGSIGQGQSGVFNTQCYTLLAGRMQLQTPWTSAQVAEFSSNPWQILSEQRTVLRRTLTRTITAYYPGSDISVAGWTSSSSGSLYADIDDVALDRGDYITSPDLSTSATFGWKDSNGSPATIPAGSWSVDLDASYFLGASGQVRLVWLDAGGSSVGATSWQTLTGTDTSYNLSITTTGPSTQFRYEVAP